MTDAHTYGLHTFLGKQNIKDTNRRKIQLCDANKPKIIVRKAATIATVPSKRRIIFVLFGVGPFAPASSIAAISSSVRSAIENQV